MFQQRPGVSNNKQICSFFLKGTCKYGTRCWNIHPQNQGGTGMTSAFVGGAGNVFGAKTSTQQDSKEFQDFAKQVSGEMNLWERSGQWLFSCFAPLKGRPPLAGFSDHSLEELRVEAYDALKANTSNSYQTHWGELQQRYKQLRDALKLSTPEAMQAMREVFHAKSTLDQQEQQQTLKPTSLFGKPPGQTVFGGTAPQAGSGVGLLGPKPQSSIFGGTTTVFGGSQPTTPSIFGGAANKPVFGGQSPLGAPNTGTFGNQNSNIFGGGNNNVFKSGTQNSTNTSLFGGTSQSQTSTGTLFGGSTSSTASGQPTSNIFGGQNQGTGNNVFNSSTQNQPNLFGGTGANVQGSGFPSAQTTSSPGVSNAVGGQGSIFGNQQQGLFGALQTQQQQPASVFGRTSVFGSNPSTPVSSASVQNSTPNIFGGAAGGSVFGNNSVTSTSSIFGGGGNAPPSGGNGLFGNVQATGPFSKPSNVFGNNNETSANAGLFGKPSEATQSTIVQGTPGLFGQTVAGSSNSVSSSVGDSSGLYTPLDQLKPEDRTQFEAEAFTSIPHCPPPKELCV